MKPLFIFILLLSSSPALPDTSVWSIHLQANSHWRNGNGFIIHSTGKYGLATGLNDNNIKICKSSKLNNKTIKKIYRAIQSIPKEIPYNSSLNIHSLCSDESKNMLQLTINNKIQNFSYSQLKSCQHYEKDIPKWLSSLVNILWEEYEKIKNCNTNA